MREAHEFRWCSVWFLFVGLFLGFARLGVCGGKNSVCDGRTRRTELWRAAWEKAACVASPIDAGKTKIDLVTLAVQTQQVPFVLPLIACESQIWVRVSCSALSVASAALNGDVVLAEQRMKRLQAQVPTVNEWRRNFVEREMSKAEAAIVLLGRSENRPDVKSLKMWVAEAPERRMPAAAWIGSEWLSRQMSDPRSPQFDRKQMLFLLLTVENYATQTFPAERAKWSVRLAPALVAFGVQTSTEQWVQTMVDGKRIAAWPPNGFEKLVDFAELCSGLGGSQRASALLNEAARRAERGQTGDADAPWAALAVAQSNMGRPVECVKTSLLSGIRRAGERPGYHRHVAESLTLGWMAAFPCEWTDAEMEMISQAVDLPQGLQKGTRKGEKR